MCVCVCVCVCVYMCVYMCVSIYTIIIYFNITIWMCYMIDILHSSNNSSNYLYITCTLYLSIWYNLSHMYHVLWCFVNCVYVIMYVVYWVYCLYCVYVIIHVVYWAYCLYCVYVIIYVVYWVYCLYCVYVVIYVVYWAYCLYFQNKLLHIC